MMSLGDLYRCGECGSGIDPKAYSTLRLVTGWVKGAGGKSLHYIEQEEWKYLHDWCMEIRKRGLPETGSLF